MDQTPTRCLQEQYQAEPARAPDMFDGWAWFAVVAQPGRQQLAHSELLAQGYGAFLPMCIRERKNGRVMEAVERPLFERYLFAGVDLDGGQSFSPIRNTRGVAMVVQDASKAPCRIPVASLRKVKARCDRDGGKVDLRPGGRMLSWGRGTELRVTDGALQGLKAVFIGAYGEQAARALVEVFGRPTVATIPLASLEKAAF